MPSSSGDRGDRGGDYGYGGRSSGSEGLGSLGDMLSSYDRDDAARDTDSDRGEVDQAWSDAAAEGDDG